MPDVHIVRHGDRWAVQEGPDAMPFFESQTREEAEAEAHRRAAGGRVHVSGEETEAEPAARGEAAEPPGEVREPLDGRPHAADAGGRDAPREPQAGL